MFQRPQFFLAIFYLLFAVVVCVLVFIAFCVCCCGWFVSRKVINIASIGLCFFRGKGGGFEGEVGQWQRKQHSSNINNNHSNNDNDNGNDNWKWKALGEFQRKRKAGVWGVQFENGIEIRRFGELHEAIDKKLNEIQRDNRELYALRWCFQANKQVFTVHLRL